MMKEPDSWTLEVSGVGKPRSFTVAELKKLGLAAVPMVLQCSGNGRAWFPHKPSGTQWTVGAAGCVIFTGVPVKAVLEAVGGRSEEHTSELQSLMRISYAVFCLKKKKHKI